MKIYNKLSGSVNKMYTEYILNGDQIVRQITKTVSGMVTNTIDFFYDENNEAYGFNYNKVPYYYVRNAQGDIIEILNAKGVSVVQYTYDAWGKLLSTTGSMASTVGKDNPLRYKGYYYDTENGLYYLQSRYYDPEIGRFLNTDTVLNTTGETNGFSLYTYCGHNPILKEDSSGLFPFETIFDVASIGSSVYELATKPSWANVGYLAWDIAATVVPYAPGSYTVKAAKYAGKAADASKVAKAAKAAKTAKVAKVSKAAVKTGKVADGACFVAGTLVAVENGLKPIEEVKIGQFVYSENLATGEKGLKKVKNVFINETDTLIHVFAGTEEIKTTKTHPFWVEGKGWIPASDLKAGDALRLSDGKILNIRKIEVERLNEPIKVYNFEVEDWHTYYVSDTKVLVHNTCSRTIRMTTKQAKVAARKLGYVPTNYKTKQGEIIFYNKKTKMYISQDVGSRNGMGSHNGGIWKAARTRAGLNNRNTRLGTYDANMNRITHTGYG